MHNVVRYVEEMINQGAPAKASSLVRVVRAAGVE
jgi:hypothetical protein